jgi:hypothetical protein
LRSQVVFRGWQGQLPLDLVEKDRSVAGKIAPEFFTRGGEARQLPATFVEAVHAVVAALNCLACSHSHFLIEPGRRQQQGDDAQAETANGEQATSIAGG